MIDVGMPLLSCPDDPILPAVVSGDEPREKMDLVTYFGKRPPGVLHCTTKFCDFGKATGAEEYAQQDVSAPQGHQRRRGGAGFWKRALAEDRDQKLDSSSGKMTSAPAHPSGWLRYTGLRRPLGSPSSSAASLRVRSQACPLFRRWMENAGWQQAPAWPKLVFSPKG